MLLTLLAYMLSDDPKEQEEQEYDYSIDCETWELN